MVSSLPWRKSVFLAGWPLGAVLSCCFREGGCGERPPCGKVLKNKKSWREKGCEEKTCWAAAGSWGNWKQTKVKWKKEEEREKGMGAKVYRNAVLARTTQPLHSVQKCQVSRKALVVPPPDPQVCFQLCTASSQPPMFVSGTRPWATNAWTLTHFKKTPSLAPSTGWCTEDVRQVFAK